MYNEYMYRSVYFISRKDLPAGMYSRSMSPYCIYDVFPAVPNHSSTAKQYVGEKYCPYRQGFYVCILE